MKLSFKKVIGFSILFSGIGFSIVMLLGGFSPAAGMEEYTGEKMVRWLRTYWPADSRDENVTDSAENPGVIPTPGIITGDKISGNIREIPGEIYWRIITMNQQQRQTDSSGKWERLSEQDTEKQIQQVVYKPSATSLYTAAKPATRYPLLTWTVVEGAVYYEVELLKELPENPNSTVLSQHSLWSTREVYKNGYMADLAWFEGDVLYWRVRGLDYYGEPLGVFSDAQVMHVDKNDRKELAPLLTVDFNADGQSTPLYPVYAWIPIPGAVAYEVEVTNNQPENPAGIKPSQYRIWDKRGTGYDIYDDVPRNQPGTYYWRVRGLDEAGNPVGVYSEAGKFTVDLSQGNYAACFGDSITHGGGAISYSPSDLEYDYETYLDFPAVNLGRSGDTTETMVGRFTSDVLPFQPCYLLILGGTNSLRGGTPGAQIVRELIEIRSMCEKYDIRPIFLTVPPVNPEAIERAFGEETAPRWQQERAVVNQFIRQQKYYIDIERFLSNKYGLLPEDYAVDGLHPDIEGKKIIAKIINENWALVTR